MTSQPLSTNATLAARIHAVAERAGLGAQRSIHRAAPPSLWRIAKFALPFIALGALAIYLYLYGPEGSFWVMGLFLMTPWLACGAVVVTLGYRRLTYGSKSRLDLFDHGVVHCLRGQPRAVRYDATRLFERTQPRRHSTTGEKVVTLTLTGSDGDEIEVTEMYEGQRAWAPAIRAAVLVSQLPTALATIESGRRVEFGDLWLTATEVGDRKKRVPIAELTATSVILDDILFIEAGRRKLNGSVISKTPNYVVFRALLNHLHGGPI
ncbi:DUF6585 family protein [Nocardia sp. NPDC058640]|uniref:DUF6585 family protein n=1 Tax=Nocardia sp. NPDC058640 TaxID=3346571 RepID=UPI00365BD280